LKDGELLLVGYLGVKRQEAVTSGTDVLSAAVPSAQASPVMGDAKSTSPQTALQASPEEGFFAAAFNSTGGDKLLQEKTGLCAVFKSITGWSDKRYYVLMNDIAPDGTYFGTTEGDGSDFGFWLIEDEYYDDEDEYAEGGEVEDWMEQALDSLMEETGSTDLEISYVSDNGNSFYATDNNLEYRVFKSEDDAEEVAVEQVRGDLEGNAEYFNQDWLMNYIDGRDFFEEALTEMNDGYVQDIESETYKTKYANRLIDELVENGLMDEDDAESDNAEELADDLKYDYVALLTQEKLEEGNDGLDYFINNFGEKETYKMVMDNNLIDIDEASRDAVQSDGIAHFLSSYDGETLYLSDDCVAYRIN
jgi:hypothetical protein